MHLCAVTTVFTHYKVIKTATNGVTVSLSVFPQDQVDAAVKQLLALKAEYKQVTGQEYKPGAAPVQKAPAPVQKATAPVQNSPSPAPAATGIYEKVAEQGEVVRKLKVEKAPKVRRYQCYHSYYYISIYYQCFQTFRVFVLLNSPATVPAALTKRFSSCWLFIRIR